MRGNQPKGVGLIRIGQVESEIGEGFLRIRSDRGSDASIGGMR